MGNDTNSLQTFYLVYLHGKARIPVRAPNAAVAAAGGQRTFGVVSDWVEDEEGNKY